MNNVAGVALLQKEVHIDDFEDPLYYEIYTKIVEFFIESKIPSYPDLKFKFKEDLIVLDIIDKMKEEVSPLNDLNAVYEELCEQSRKRKLKDLGTFIATQVKESSAKDIINNVETKLFQINLQNSTSIDSISDLESGYLKELNTKVQKFNQFKTLESTIDLPTGFSSLDFLTLGLQKQNTWVIGGATSDGKTAFAVQFVDSIIRRDQGVVIFMLEDSRTQLLNRFVSLRTAIPISKLRCGSISDKEVEKVNHAIDSLKQGHRLFVDDTIIDINEIIVKTKFLKLKYPYLSVLVLDHINLAVDSLNAKGNREQELSGISKKLISLAKSCNIAVLILQQLNTGMDDRNENYPIVNDLRDSKAPGHDAAIVTLIWCPDKYNKDKNFSRKNTQLILAKNRYGEAGLAIKFTSHAHIAKYVEVVNG